jgi:hypothetical protein
MTQEEEKLIQLRQALMLDLQKDILKWSKILTMMYVLLVLIGATVALILFLNRDTNNHNGEKLERLIEAIKEKQ